LENNIFLICYVQWQCVTILLYADDIIIVAPTVMSLQILLHIVELELEELDMEINVKKSHCMRIGPKHDVACCSIITRNGIALEWVDTIRYLGIELVTGNFIPVYMARRNRLSTAHSTVFFEKNWSASVGGSCIRTSQDQMYAGNVIWP
jgi:hypothetical protein